MIIKVMRAVILCGCTLATDAVLAQEQEHLRNCANCKTYSSEFRDGTSETEDFSRKEVLPLLQSPPPRSSKITSEHDSSPTGNTVSSLKNVKFPSLADVVTARKDLSISGCCHVLIFYGRGDTDLSLFRSGNEALKTLTDERVATAFFGKTPFVETRNGLRFVLSGDPLSHDAFGEAHRDQCLATFGLLNLPLSTPIFLTGRDYTIRDLLAETIASFTWDEKEITWTALALTTYLPPHKAWTNRFRERFSFNDLANVYLNRNLKHESCAGTHALQFLCNLERADVRWGLLDSPTRQLLTSFITTTLDTLTYRQKDDGAWGLDWAVPRNSVVQGRLSNSSLLITGHILEVLNALPPKRRPKEGVYLNAAKWIHGQLKATRPSDDGAVICPFTHAAKAANTVLKVSDFSSQKIEVKETKATKRN